MNTFAKVLSKWEKIALTYVSVATPVVFGAYQLGVHSHKDLLIIAAAALSAPILKAINPSDPAYGVVKVAVDALAKEAANVTPKA